MGALLTTENLTVVRQGKHILKDISITIGSRDFITIIGPNGAGKSMLLKCLMGFYRPDDGVITRKKGLKIGYVPQSLVLNHAIPISVRHFLCLRKKTDPKNLHKISIEIGIEEILDKAFSTLSGGELQRVLMARSLLDNPEMLILDEPAQNLDISGQISLYKLLERLYQERHLSILMVSHDLHMVMASTNQVLCLFHHICCSGEPQVVTQDPEFISLFGSDMADMIAVYQHKHHHTHEKHKHA